jgi:GT2 family glycosyltransferase
MYISAVIPTRNRPDDLIRTVNSIIRQNLLPDELLIIDQSRDDISKNLVMNLFAEQGDSINLKYILDDSIQGLVAAKEVAVSIGLGDIIMFLEDDVVLEEDYIDNMAQGFIDHPEMMGSCGVVTEVPNVNKFYQSFFHLFHRGIFYDKRVGVHGNSKKWEQLLIQSNYLSGGLSAYRREVFEKVKFDTKNDFFMLEDINFSTRVVREFGEDRFFINTSARLQHKMSAVNRSKFKVRYERKLREYICFYKLNCDQKMSLTNLLWLLIGLFIEACFESLKSLNFGPLKGSLAGLVKGIRQKI